MGLITRTYSSTTDVITGATILAAHINTDLDKIYAEFNGNIENANIKAGAAIAISKTAIGTYVAMVAYTPTLESGAIDFDFATKECWYIRVGNVVWYNIYLTGAVTTGSATLAKISLPVSGVAGVTQSVGTGGWYDNDVVTLKQITCGITSGDEGNMRMYRDGSSLNGSAFAANDELYFQGFYRVA